MKIAVIGAGSTYTPELIEGLIKRKESLNIKELALMDIDSKKLEIVGGLALDAYEQEPVKDSSLVGMDNVVSTPHTGAHTNEAISSMGMLAVENLINVLQQKECPNIIA